MLKKVVLTVSLGAMLAALTTSTLAARAIPSAYGDTITVAPYSTITYRPILFTKDEEGVVSITGSGATMLDVAVFESPGQPTIPRIRDHSAVTFPPHCRQGMSLQGRQLGCLSETTSML